MRIARRLVGLIRRAGAGLLAPAEDPRKAFASSYARQQQLLTEIQGSLADVAALKSELASLVASTEARLPALQEEARAALREGRDDLARHLVQRRVIAGEELEDLKGQLTELEAEEQRLVGAKRGLAAQIESFSAQQQMAAARLTTTEAQARLTQSLRSVAQELEALGIALGMAGDKVESMQAHASEIHAWLTAPEEQSRAGARKAIEQKLSDRNLNAQVEREVEALRRERR